MNNSISAYNLCGYNVIDTFLLISSEIYKNNLRAISYFEDTNLMNECNNKLWTFSSEKFIPHSSNHDGLDIKMQHIYLSDNLKFYDDNFNVVAFYINNESYLDHVNKYILPICAENINIQKVVHVFDASKIFDVIQYKELFSNDSVIKCYYRDKDAWKNV